MVPSVEKITRTDAGLASQLRVSVARLNRRLRSERDPDTTLSLTGLSVLGALFREGESTVGRLAEHERVQPPSMTRTVSCLVEDWYVVRRPHDTDGRQTVLSLSEKGRETVRQERRRRDAWLALRLRELSPEDRDVLRRAAPILEELSQRG